MVIQVFKSQAEIAEKPDGNSRFQYADELVSSRSDMRMKRINVIEHRHLAPVGKIQSALELGFTSTGIIIIPEMDPGFHDIHLG